MVNSVLGYISAIFDHWLFSWGAVGLLVVAMIEKLHKPISKKWFVAAAGVCLLIAMFQAWKDENERAEKSSDSNKTLSAQNDALQQRNSDLTNQLVAKERPIVLQPTPDKEIEKLLRRQDEELARLKTQLPSPKKKALQLSNDMIKFSQNVTRNYPSPPIIQGAKTREEFQAQMDQYDKSYVQWMQNVAADYDGQFAVRIASLEDDIKTSGLIDTIEMCQHSNGNTFMLERCAALIGVLAEKLP